MKKTKENPLDKLFEKFPNFRKEAGWVVDIFLEEHINGSDAALIKFHEYSVGKLKIPSGNSVIITSSKKEELNSSKKPNKN